MNTNTPASISIFRSKMPVLLDTVRWCQRATDATADRSFCRVLHVLDEDRLWVVGTDGARMHAAEWSHPSHILEPGVYTINRSYKKLLELKRLPLVEQQTHQLPNGALELLHYNTDQCVKVEWERHSEQTYPSDLYRLICEIGEIVPKEDANGRPIGFNPDYLTDAIEQAYKLVYLQDDRMLHFFTEETELAPAYHAVVMGMKL